MLDLMCAQFEQELTTCKIHSNVPLKRKESNLKLLFFFPRVKCVSRIYKSGKGGKYKIPIIKLFIC